MEGEEGPEVGKKKQTEEGGGKQREKVTLGVSTRGCSNKTQEANLFLLRCCRKVQQLPRQLGAALTRMGKINNTGPRSLPR